MRELYCGTIGFEFDHLEEEAERDWFRRAIEERQITASLSGTRSAACSTGSPRSTASSASSVSPS
jgi:2-oxoglutarate dehydrogenase complex dehydrogenase (E1) component-like enzyme